MTTPKPRSGGRAPKDAPISDGYNPTKLGPHATKKEIAAAKRTMRLEKERLEHERRKQQVELDKVAKQVAKVQEKIGVSAYETGGDGEDELSTQSPDASPVASPDEDDKSAQQMLQHLRYAYRNSVGPNGKKGRSRLVELMENDGEFKFAVKELMKIEASLLAAKIRRKDEGNGGVGQQNFFVVLKGLEEDKKFLPAGKVDKTVDMKQIQRAINPDAIEVFEEEDSQRGAPVQLSRGSGSTDEGNATDNMEGW
jgi:hypothetical protein